VCVLLRLPQILFSLLKRRVEHNSKNSHSTSFFNITTDNTTTPQQSILFLLCSISSAPLTLNVEHKLFIRNKKEKVFDRSSSWQRSYHFEYDSTFVHSQLHFLLSFKNSENGSGEYVFRLRVSRKRGYFVYALTLPSYVWVCHNLEMFRNVWSCVPR
jgi:hypothetical protein